MGDWPPYYFVTEGEDDVKHMRLEYAALITMCDHYLGKVLDKMDEYGLWEDTMLIVNTDHGFLLGEHDWWSKSIMPVYEEISHTPLFIYDPVSKTAGERRGALTQTIDLPVTILDFFGMEIPKDMQGKSLFPVIREGKKVREYAIFGYHDGHCNLTDGNWVYMKAPLDKTELNEYTLMPTHMNSRFPVAELQDIRLEEPFSFTKGCRTMKVGAKTGMNDAVNFGTKLFCLEEDPKQEHPLMDIEKETELANEMVKLMRENDCPAERYARFGFPEQGEVTKEHILAARKAEIEDRIPEGLKDLEWERGAVNMYHAVKRFLGEGADKAQELLIQKAEAGTITRSSVGAWMMEIAPAGIKDMMWYFAALASRTE